LASVLHVATLTFAGPTPCPSACAHVHKIWVRKNPAAGCRHRRWPIIQ